MNILVIKHGALGDFVMASGAMKSIRNYFPKDNILLLTEEKNIKFFKSIPYFNSIKKDNRKSMFFSIFTLFNIIFSQKINLIIDLQNSSRTQMYHFFVSKFTKVKISSSRNYSHYRYIIPKQGDEHVIQGLNNQLFLLGLKTFEDPNLSWMIQNSNQQVKKKYIILIPGASKTGSYKKWPEDRYAKLSNHFIENGFDIYLTGSNEDLKTMELIKATCPLAKIKIKESKIENFLELCQNASFIVANDTGPTHIAALSNRPLFWIAIDNSISKACQPFGKRVIPILSKNLLDIDPKKIIEKINSIKLS
jgi:ADP-heptose:LPS heptosyltransferase